MTEQQFLALTTLEDLKRWAASRGQAAELVARLSSELRPASGSEYRCHELSSSLRTELVRAGIRAQLLMGDVPCAAKEWRRHYVTLIELPDGWLTVDLACGQFPKLESYQLLAVSAASKAGLGEALRATYGGWA